MVARPLLSLILVAHCSSLELATAAPYEDDPPTPEELAPPTLPAPRFLTTASTRLIFPTAARRQLAQPAIGWRAGVVYWPWPGLGIASGLEFAPLVKQPPLAAGSAITRWSASTGWLLRPPSLAPAFVELAYEATAMVLVSGGHRQLLRDNGWRIAGGARHRVAERFEVGLALSFETAHPATVGIELYLGWSR